MKHEPTVLYRNSSPSTAQTSGALGNVPDISAYDWIFVEVCWSTSYTSYRSGTWVYVPDGTSVKAIPAVPMYSNNRVANAYREVTISKNASPGSQISLSTGHIATTSSNSSDSAAAIVTTIIGF